MSRITPLHAAAIVALLQSLPYVASAQPDYVLGASTTADNGGAYGAVEARLRVGSTQLAFHGQMGRARATYVAGYRISDARLGRGALEARFALGEWGGARFGLHLEAGFRRLANATNQTANDYTASWAIEASLSLIATMPIRARGAFRAGILVPFSIEVVPETINDVIGTVLVLGGAVAATERVWIYADIETGGITGADGDAGKYLFRGTFGIRALLGRSTTRDFIAF